MALRGTSLPGFIVINSYYNTDKGFVQYKENEGAGAGTGSVVLAEDESVFSTLVKVEVERAKSAKYAGTNYVHLRFSNSNKYWARSSDGSLIVAKSTVPEEDTSKPSCTLFDASWVDGHGDGVFTIVHVPSGARVRIDGQTKALYADDKAVPGEGYFKYVDWDTLVKLPKHVAFKGDNGAYLKGYWFNNLYYLQFGSWDPNDEVSGHEIELLPDGHVKIKSLHFSGRFWRFGLYWIWADTFDTSITNQSLLFWPVKIDDNTIALRTADHNLFCKRLTADGKTDCLNAASSTITNESRLVVQELVLERRIFDVRYRMEDARIFDEKPFLAGTTTGENNADLENSVAVSLTYRDSKSYSFSRSLSLTAGVKTTIKADALGIVGGEIEFSFEVSGSFEWNNTTTTETEITATGTVRVPPKSRAIVDYVGTVGTCNVPYSYRQEDKSSTDGKVVTTDEIDGVYTGVNCYNFSFVVRAYEPL